MWLPWANKIKLSTRYNIITFFLHKGTLSERKYKRTRIELHYCMCTCKTPFHILRLLSVLNSSFYFFTEKGPIFILICSSYCFSFFSTDKLCCIIFDIPSLSHILSLLLLSNTLGKTLLDGSKGISLRGLLKFV